MTFKGIRADGHRKTGIRQLINLIGVGLAVTSIVQELRLPPADRTWHGTLFGRIPYDWRPPTLTRMRETFWNAENPSVIVPTLFGVGWSINVAALPLPFARRE